MAIKTERERLNDTNFIINPFIRNFVWHSIAFGFCSFVLFSRDYSRLGQVRSPNEEPLGIADARFLQARRSDALPVLSPNQQQQSTEGIILWHTA